MSLTYALPETEVQSLLQDGETVVWAGGPRPGIAFGPEEWGTTVFALFWTGFAVFWESMALFGTRRASGAAAIFAPIWGVPFVCVGLYMLIGRHFVAAYVRRRTSYVLTDRRAIIHVRTSTRSTRFMSLANAGEVTVRERADGSGDIVFGEPKALLPQMPPQKSFRVSSESPRAATRATPEFAFARIEGVASVARRVAELHAAVRSA